ncbi:MAG: hypothetical protein JWQ16_3437 [Novosphingobium sp.]|nr:hypothetical protein [Novosphingobium sp.]
MTELGAQSTADEVLSRVDLTGLRVLVTGVSAGLGVETARAAAAHGARVVGTARDLRKAGQSLAEYRDLNIEVVDCDLASLRSIRACTSALADRSARFDVLIANAGVMNCPFGQTEDGFETHFGTNHLGHFTLINRLLPQVADGGRIVILSSSAHQASDVDLDDPGFERSPYDPFVAYGRSKTANVLTAMALDHRLRDRGIRTTALHPGGIMTELLRHTTPDMLQQMAAQSALAADGTQGTPTVVKTVEQGAATTAWAAFVASADEVGGRYCEDCGVARVSVAGGGGGVRPYALNQDRANALWDKSEQLIGEGF